MPIATALAALACTRADTGPALTEAECRKLAQQELEVAAEVLPPDRAAAMHAAGNTIADAKVAECAADATISRPYFECMASAKSLVASRACIGAERARR